MDRSFPWLGAAILVLAVSCGGDDGAGGTLIFGEFDELCPATVLRNEEDDADLADAGSHCFLAAHHLGEPVVWDLLVPTIEGDPLVWRYDYDGDAITITADQTRDEFGSGDVVVRRCRGVQQPSPGSPLVGIDCDDVDGDGFASDSLPW